jgi:hypothetical protein
MRRNAADQAETLLICCGAMAREILTLVERNGWDSLRVECLPANLHNAPERIPEALRDKIRSSRDRYDDIVVLYTDCGTGGKIDEVLAEEGIERIAGSHCYEVYCGEDEFAELMRAEPGCFFLTDFLTRHFDRLILKGLGLDRFPKLRKLYFGKYKKLVYLAQTENEELEAKAREAAEVLGLEFEMRHTAYGGFEQFIAQRQTCGQSSL